MKRNDTVVVTMISITSAFVINVLLLLFLWDGEMNQGVTTILENSLIFLGLVLITSVVTGIMRTIRASENLDYMKNLYAAIFKNIDIGIAIIDESNVFDYVSPRFREIMSFNDVSLLKRNAAEVLPKSVHRFIIEYRLLPDYSAEESVEQTIVFKDTYINLKAFRVRDKHNQSKYIITAEDQTEQILMEHRLTDQLEEIQFHTNAKESLLANVSHELKTPLNAVIGLTHILEDTKLDKHQQEIVSKINVSSDFLLSLINDVLDFSKLKNGSVKLSPSHFQLKTLLNDIHNIFYPVTASQDIQFLESYDFDPDLGLHLDRLRLEQVLVNLINNACKFTDVGYIRLSVCVLQEFQETVTLKFSVEDTGIGIDPKDITNIFSEFYQLENHLTKLHQGTGLGLPICKRLVEHMGGTLWAESKKGVGSTFYFTVTAPKYYGVSDDAEEQIETTLYGHGEKILVVEDTEINYDVVNELLAKVNILCDHASSGQEAIRICSEPNIPYKVILMDIHMPEMDGYETSRRLKDMGITIPIIALTASNVDEEKQQKYGELFVDFILKPFKYTRLYSALHPYIEDVPSASALVPAEDPFAGRDLAIENLGGSTALYEKHLARFQKNYVNSGDTIEGHLHKGQRDEARILAHSIKGLAGTLGLTHLSRASADLESAISEGQEDLTNQLSLFRKKLSSVTKGQAV